MKNFVFLLFLISLIFSASPASTQVPPDTINGWYLWKINGNQSAVTYSRIVSDTAFEGVKSQAFYAGLPQNTSVEWRKNYGRKYRTPLGLQIYLRLKDGNWTSGFSANYQFFLVHADTVYPVQGGGLYPDQSDMWYFHGHGIYGTPPSFFDQLILKFFFRQAGISGWYEILFDELTLAYYDSTRVIDRFGDSRTELVFPPNCSVNLPETLDLSWENYIHPVSHYHVQVGTDENFANLVVNDSTVEGTSKTVTLQNGVWHYWRVRSNDGNSWDDFSPTWIFHISPELPAQVILVSPPDSAQLSGNFIDLVWLPSSPDIDKYYLEIAADPNFIFKIIDSIPHPYTQYRFSNISPNIMHYWRVRAYNARLGPFSEVRRFLRITTDVKTVGALPTQFALYENFPNPFNPLTIVNFQLPIGSWVKLKIFDALGREVATLVDEYKNAGYYEATWNAAGFPRGVYFCRMHSGDFVETKKLVLVR